MRLQRAPRMKARDWILYLHVRRDGRPVLRLSIDGQLSSPMLQLWCVAEALDYLDRALADFGADDSLSLVALHAPGPFACWRARDPAVALRWCTIMLARAPVPHPAEGPPPRSRV